MRKRTVLALIAAALFAQPGKKLTFDVVSIKAHKSGDDPTMYPLGVVDGRYTGSNLHLQQLIVAAYVDSAAPYQSGIEITGLPRWAVTDGFDVQAQTEAGLTPTKQQTMEMIQAVLEDRFKLKIRRVPKNTSIYALVIDKDGLKMKESLTPTGPPPGARPGAGRIIANSTAMLVSVLNLSAGRKVVDKTGLTGRYEIDLNFRPDPLPPGAEIDPNLPSVFTAVREQLGLRLLPETGEVDTFVVESFEKPSEN